MTNSMEVSCLMDGLNQAKMRVENDFNNVYKFYRNSTSLEQFLAQTLEDKNASILLSLHQDLEQAISHLIQKM